MKDTTTPEPTAKPETTSEAQDHTQPSLGPVPTGHRFTTDKIAQEAAQQFTDLGLTEWNAAVVGEFEEQARLQVQAATPLSIDTNASKGDEFLNQDLHDARAVMVDAQNPSTDIPARLYEARKNAALAEPPLSSQSRLRMIAATLSISALPIAALWALMTSTVAELLLHSYYRQLLGRGGLAESHQQAQILIIVCAATLVFSETGLVLLTWGKIRLWVKALFFLAACLFSGGFGLLRMKGGYTEAALTYSVFEFGILIAFSGLLVGLSAYLKEDGDKAAAYRLAKDIEALEENEETLRQEQLKVLKQEYRAIHRTVAQREDDVRRGSRYEELAAKNVRAGALVATIKNMGRFARDAYASDSPEGPGAAGSAQDVAEHDRPDDKLISIYPGHAAGGVP